MYVQVHINADYYDYYGSYFILSLLLFMNLNFIASMYVLLWRKIMAKFYKFSLSHWVLCEMLFNVHGYF